MHRLGSSISIGTIVLLGSCGQAFALNADGHLVSDWEVTLQSSNMEAATGGAPSGGQSWAPATTTKYQYTLLGNNRTTNGASSGGEWYDIEALYLRLNIEGEYLTGIDYAVVTSYNGYDHPNTYAQWWNSPTSHPDDDWTAISGAWASDPYRVQPVIAIDLNNDIGGNPSDPAYRLVNWDLGLMLATDAQLSRANYPAGPDSSGIAFTGGSVIYSPTLYDTRDAIWRGGAGYAGFGDPDGEPTSLGDLRPVDFDAASLGDNILGDGTGYYGYAYASDGTPYTEDPSSQMASPANWAQSNDYCWEGSVTLAGQGYFVGLLPGGWEPSIFYSMWCANDTGQGDGIGTPEDSPGPVPEPASLGLLALAVGGVGAALKRRRK